MMRITPMVKNILIINVVVFFIQAIFSLPLSRIAGLYVIFADNFQPYQVVTYMWIHGGFGHILGNMFAVFIFGPMLETVWGSKRFLTFYLICGIGAGVLYGTIDLIEKLPIKNDREAFLEDPTPEKFELYILDYKVSPRNSEMLAEFSDKFYGSPNSDSYIAQSKQFVNDIFEIHTEIPMVGASGAVFGILMAFGMLFPNTQLFLLFPPIPVKAKYLVLFYGLYELYSEFSRMPGDNVAHLAHLGGMLIAFILLKLWQKDSRKFY